MAKVGTDRLYAQQLLTAGHAVAIPTETVYGLAGNAYDEAAVAKLFAIKQRPRFDPLIVHTGSVEQAQTFVGAWPAGALRLAERLWPGPLTLLLPRRPAIPDIVTAGLPRLAVRIPQHPLTLALLQQLPFPLAAPSANPFGYISPTTPLHVQAQLGAHVPYVLDGGACAVGVESTIVGFDDEKPVVQRLGGTCLEEIEAVVGPVTMAAPAAQAPQASGMLLSHYAPTKPLHMGPLPTLLALHGRQQVGVLAFDRLCAGVAPAHQVLLAPTGTLEEAAQRLFAALRTLDALPTSMILADWVPDVGLGKAINDRLRRAAST